LGGLAFLPGSTGYLGGGFGFLSPQSEIQEIGGGFGLTPGFGLIPGLIGIGAVCEDRSRARAMKNENMIYLQKSKVIPYPLFRDTG
jgi:hypothetical protein